MIQWCSNFYCSEAFSLTTLNRVDSTEPGGYSRKFHAVRLNPEIQPLTLLYTNLDRKVAPFVYLLLTNGTRFTYLV